MRDRGPVTEVIDEREVVYIDGKVVRRDPVAFMEAIRPPGAHDPAMRLADLDEQGIWAELIFPSRALWVHLSDDPALQLACSQIYNDWLHDEIMSRSPRFIGAAMLPTLDTADAVAELQRNVARGFQTVFLPTSTPPGRDYNSEDWLPLWAAAEEAGISLSFHIGTGADPKVFRGLGGAITNHVASFYPAQTTLCHLVASGVLDAHPEPARVVRGVRWFLAAGGHGADGRGAAPVRHLVPAAEAADAAERVRQAAGARELPARPSSAGGQGHLRRGRPDVGQRLPAPRGHLPQHPQGAGGHLRGRLRRGAEGDHRRQLRQAVLRARSHRQPEADA